MRAFQQYMAVLEIEGADDDYRDLFDERDQAVLGFVVGGRLTWRKLAMFKYGPVRKARPARQLAPVSVAVMPAPVLQAA